MPVKKQEKMPIRDRVMMMKREMPKRVTLPNGRTYVARYECVTRDHLPANIPLGRPYKQRAELRGRC